MHEVIKYNSSELNKFNFLYIRATIWLEDSRRIAGLEVDADDGLWYLFAADERIPHVEFI